MCLDTILDDERVPAEGTGWKLFSPHFTCDIHKIWNLWFLYRPLYESWAVQEDVWLCAQKQKLETYVSGFHIYLEKPPFLESGVPHESQVLTEVKFRGGRILGMQHFRKVVVAVEMFVPKEKPRQLVWF